MAKRKHSPQRTCLGCREIKSKRELIRIVRTPEGQVIVDPTGKANGRGVYICRQTQCLEKGLKKESLAQSLKVNLSPEQAAALLASIQTEFSKV
jgi:predicted RNA-binding protein YlxR (DUF448 family)